LSVYNSLAGATQIAFALDDYVTRLALDGLFLLLADEERRIRKDPDARVTELLRRLFG
jgi:hypothetical protein